MAALNDFGVRWDVRRFSLLRGIREFLNKRFGYRPNRCYMRGPGPACGSDTTADRTEQRGA
jgi:hypothetical protein